MLDESSLSALSRERLDWTYRAIPTSAHGYTISEWLKTAPTFEDLQTPTLTLGREALQHNIAAMATWCKDANVSLAPHGKTTMAPQLWREQLDAGAWGITLANIAQLRVARAFGVPRVFLANEMVSASAVSWLADWIDDGADVTCLVDSTAAVEAMAGALGGRDTVIDVCVEVGGAGGRAGVRDVAAAVEVARAVHTQPRLRLAGVSGYEGTVAHGAEQDSVRAVDEFLTRLRHAHEAMDYETDSPLVSAGGSAYFDQVVEHLGHLSDTSATVLLRSGCYVIHDDVRYAQSSPSARGRSGPKLYPALRLAATVLSVPEPGLAIADIGRRDVGMDSGYPVLVEHPKAHVEDLNDQHVYIAGDVSALNVGDIVRLGISHPCTTMDKWNLIPVVDRMQRIVDVVRTFF